MGGPTAYEEPVHMEQSDNIVRPPWAAAPSAKLFRERLMQTLSAQTNICDGNCGMTERECWDVHPLNWAGTIGGVVLLEAPITAIADVAVEVARELGLLPPEQD